jgi:hypothetical protein
MIGTWVAIAFIAAFLAWLLGAGRHSRPAAPEDDLETPIDQAELDEAERAVRNDPDAKAAADAVDSDDDDWGPGSGHSPLPGVL